MSKFDQSVEYILQRESGLVENPLDPGGITNFGISIRFLKSLSIDQLKKYGLYFGETINNDDIKHLTLDSAKSLYKGEFWDHAPFALINDQSLCNYIFDTSINMGISPAIKALQRAIWAYNKNRNCLKEDGILSQETINLVNRSNAMSLLSIMRSERAGDYRVIVAHYPEQKEFINGWLNRAYE